jgi:N-acetylglucosamine-6-phosphate deacetylase
MSRLVIGGRVILEDRICEEAVLVCEAGKIEYVGPRREEVPDVVLTDGYIAPGYVDIHIHGCQGHDVMDGTETALQGISQALVTRGVTGFLATTLTADLQSLLHVLELCREFANEQIGADRGAGASLLGVHLEGPWINKRYRGAQNEAHVVPPCVEEAKSLLAAAGGLLKVVTLAPEQPHAYEVIAYLHEQGVKASVGHTDATYEHVQTALQHGLSHVTHCFNAMRGLHHREPGVVGAAMHHDELTTELIADGVHVHPVVMSILYRIKQAAKLVLVSDSMRAVGLGDGEYDLGCLRVQMKNGEARLEDGTLAGSTLTLERAVQNMVRLCNVSLPDAVRMASATPAEVIGFGDRKGKLAAGYDADFLLLDDELNVRQTYVGGQLAYAMES